MIAVVPDDSSRAALDVALRRRYEPDYAVVVVDDPITGLRQLGEYRDAHEQVAVLIAPFRMTDRDGIGFLIDARTFHPSAASGADDRGR